MAVLRRSCTSTADKEAASNLVKYKVKAMVFPEAGCSPRRPKLSLGSPEKNLCILLNLKYNYATPEYQNVSPLMQSILISVPITRFLGFKVNLVIKRQFYNGIIGKMTISWSFFYNSFVKFHKKNLVATK